MKKMEAEPKEIKKRTRSRTFICSVTLVMAFTYFGVFFLLFAAGLFYKGPLTGIFELYLPNEENLVAEIDLFLISGFLLYLAAIAGLVILMLKKRSGFYLFTLSAVLLLLIDLSFFDFDWLRYLIITGLIFVLGVFHFSGGCYPRA